jgi:hypothetical protein
VLDHVATQLAARNAVPIGAQSWPPEDSD